MRANSFPILVLVTVAVVEVLAAEPAPPAADFVFTSNRDGNSEIYLLAAGETEWRNLTNHPGPDNWPVWSPDGSLLAITMNANQDKAAVYLAATDGSELRRLTNHPSSEFAHDFSPDGSRLAFYAQDEAEGSWRPGSGPDAVEQGGSTVTGDRVLHKQIRVAAPIETVWKAWTTEEGLEFVSAKSNVRLEIGGPYEWFLDLEPDERGRRGGEGAVIHAFLPPEMLAFSWTFPPSIPSLRNAGARTRVVVRFREVDGGTEVDFHQAGWQEGDDWDRGYDYFDTAWDSVLERFKTHLEANRESAAKADVASNERGDLVSEVDRAERAFAATVVERDLNRFRSFLHPDAVFIGGASELRGPDQVVEAWRAFFDPGATPLEWEPDRVAVGANGRLAISTGPYWRETAAEDGPAQRVGGRFFSVWKRGDDGSWRVLFDAGTEPEPLD